MGFDRDAAAVIGDGQVAVGAEMHLDAVGMAGNRLVHRVVDDFGEEVVQGVGVGAADIHARPAPDGLQPLEDFDIGGGVDVGVRDVGGLGRRRRRRFGGGAADGRLFVIGAEKVDRHETSAKALRIAPSVF